MIFFKFISSLHVQRPKFWGEMDKFGGKSKTKKINSVEFVEFVFSKSVLWLYFVMPRFSKT